MDFKPNFEVEIIDVYLKRSDLCYTCKNNDKCPLINCIQHNLVQPVSCQIKLKFCELYARKVNKTADIVELKQE